MRVNEVPLLVVWREMPASFSDIGDKIICIFKLAFVFIINRIRNAR